MMKSQKIKQIHDILASGENAQKLTMHDLEFYRDHFDDLARELNVSGREFRPAFEYANKQYLRVVDIIRARLERQENKNLGGFKNGDVMVLSARSETGKSVFMLSNYCSVCTTELLEGIDEDPNGEMKSTCARCEKMEEIDFDQFPNAKVSRSGRVYYGVEK